MNKKMDSEDGHACLRKKLIAEGSLTQEDLDYLISEEKLFLLVARIIKSLVSVSKIAPIEDGDYGLTKEDLDFLFSNHALLCSAIISTKALIAARKSA